jgi:hypothetical protein
LEPLAQLVQLVQVVLIQQFLDRQVLLDLQGQMAQSEQRVLLDLLVLLDQQVLLDLQEQMVSHPLLLALTLQSAQLAD